MGSLLRYCRMMGAHFALTLGWLLIHVAVKGHITAQVALPLD